MVLGSFSAYPANGLLEELSRMWLWTRSRCDRCSRANLLARLASVPGLWLRLPRARGLPGPNAPAAPAPPVSCLRLLSRHPRACPPRPRPPLPPPPRAPSPAPRRTSARVRWLSAAAVRLRIRCHQGLQLHLHPRRTARCWCGLCAAAKLRVVSARARRGGAIGAACIEIHREREEVTE
jgi:hypothetical protein